MSYLKPILLTCLLSITSIISFAQYQWQYLSNNGVTKNVQTRYEDIIFLDTNTAFAVNLENRIVKTKNGGQSWRAVNDTNSKAIQFRSIDFLDGGEIGLAGSLNDTGVLLRTTDSGETWTDISASIIDTLGNGKKRMCGIDHFGSNFYCVGWYFSSVGKFYKSADKGATWQTKYIDTSLAKGLVDVHFTSADTGFITGTRIKNNRSNSVILRTIDSGNTWHEVFSDTIFGGYIWKIQFVNKTYAVGSVESRYLTDSINFVRSLDGGATWSILPIKSSLIAAVGYGRKTQACGFINPSTGWVGGYYHGIFETVDSGKTWTYLNFGDNFNRIFLLDSNHVYAGGTEPYYYGKTNNVTINDSNLNITAPHKLYPISPNPIRGKVPIKFNLNSETNVAIEVINIDSKKVYSVVNTHLTKGEHIYYWNSNNAPAGNYIIWLGNNEIPITQKFVLLK